MTALPPNWPADQPLAISVSIMLEGWAEPDAPGIGPMGNPLRPGIRDLQALSWAEYGPKVGAWRLLDLLEREGLQAVFYTSGVIADRYPDLVGTIAARGHPVAAHGWSQGTLPPYLSPEQEEADILRCCEILSKTAGRPPGGWLSPRCTRSASTPALLAAHGFRWHADFFDSDLPYWLEMPQGRILVMPFTMEVNDMPLYVRYGNEPEAFTRTLAHILCSWQRLGSPPACLDVTLHAHVFGRPYGAITFLDALALLRASPVCWLTNHAALAALY